VRNARGKLVPGLLGAALLARSLTAAAQPADTDAGDDASDAVPAPEFVDPSFGPRYTIEQILVTGNRKTKSALILAEIGLGEGDTVAASDPRVEAARFRLLALGYFLDARLSVRRGARRGGAVLVVEVEERGTIVINELFPSTSAATAFWGGADVSEMNFLGRGINLGGGFVASTKPLVPNAVAGLGLRLHAAIPERRAWGGLGFSATALFNNGSEFYRQSGADDDDDPGRFVAVRTRRAGGVVGVNRALTRALHAALDLRGELVQATLPAIGFREIPNTGTPPAVTPIDFQIQPGSSRVASAAASLDYDTRSDPVLPRDGMRLLATVEVASGLLGSTYDYAKLVGQASLYHKMPRGHALGLHLLGGAMWGGAPYFDRFFIGDLNLLLPRRALGINFSTLPSRNLLGTDIARHRYDNFAARVLVEYAVPIWRRHGFVYGGDAFAAVGLLGLASDGDLRPQGGLTWRTLPIDATADLGLRLDTYIGIFTISIANALSRSSF
jgi:outer membrane protein insertion porin family